MQESPDIERLARQLRQSLSLRTLVGVSDAVPGALDGLLRNVRATDLTPLLKAVQVQSVQRRGKYLLFVLRNGINPYRWLVLQWHLHASGWMVPANGPAVGQGGPALAQPHANFPSERMPALLHLDFADGQRWTYCDQRRLGRIFLWSHAEVAQGRAGPMSRIGPDWLDRPAEAARALREHLPTSRRVAKDILLDQRIAAGLGNVLACEVLHSAGLHPHRAWGHLGAAQKAALAEAAVSEAARRLTEHAADRVYGRIGDWCLRPDCAGTISAVADNKHSTRRSFFCPACQTLGDIS